MKKRVFVSLLLLGWATAGMAQVTLTHTTTSDFLKGTGNNVIIDNDMVAMQSKMTSMYDFEASTNLPQTLMNHQLVTWQDYVFCVGGYNGTTPVSDVYRASQQSDGISSWTALNSLPVPLTDMAVVASQGYLIVMGGKNDDGVSNKIYVAQLDPLDASMGEWVESSVTLPRALWGAKAITVHDNIYLIGGATTDSETAALKYVYCLKLNSRGNVVSVTAVTNLPEARSGHAVASYDSKIYVMGGHNNSGVLKTTVYCATVNLDGTLTSWSTKTALPVALKNHTAVCTNGIMAVIGGMEAELPSSTVYYTYLDNSSLAWNVGNAVLSARTHSGASVAFDNKIFFTGGMNLSGSIVNFTRFAPIGTDDAKVKKGCFVSLPFDLGTPMKNVHQLSYNIAQTENTSYEVLYRLAGENLTYGNWISASTNNPIVIDQTKQAIQYMIRLTSNGTNDIQLEDMSATMTGYTQLAGNMNDISVFSVANSPYWATSDITFTTGVHDIDPGVVIYFSRNTGITITQACVHFNGTEQAPISLKYVNGDQNYWNGIYFHGTSSYNQAGVYQDNVSSMSYTNVENAGYGDNQAVLRLQYANQPIFSHCSFSGSSHHGVSLKYSSPTFTDCNISNNGWDALFLNSSNPTVTSTTMNGNNYAVYISNSCTPTFTNCSATGNNFGVYSYTPNRSFVYDESTLALANNGIEIHVAGGSYDITTDCTWDYYDNGYWVSGGNLEIEGSNSPTLTIAAGNTIRMDAGKQIKVGYSSSYGGGIYAVGNATDSIRFTAKNGEIGGWDGFYFADASDYNSSSSLRYCVVEKATKNIYMFGTTQPQLMYSTIKDASERNIYLYDNAEINMDQCLVKNAPYGIYLSNNCTATVVMTTFENCSNTCAYHYTTDNTMNFYTCTMKDSNIGVCYYNPNVDIPTYINRITYNNVTSPVGIISDSYDYIDADHTWLKNDYSIFGNVKLRYNSCRLTIDAGSTLRFAAGKYLQVESNRELYAEGTDESPIIFTAFNGENGGWNGLKFYSASGTSLLKHCIIEKATTNVYLSSTNQPTIENCEIRYAIERGIELNSSSPSVIAANIHHNGTNGMYLSSSSPNVEFSHIHHNGTNGMYLYNSSSPTVKLSRIHQNSTNGIYIDGYSTSYDDNNPTFGNTTLTGNDIVANGSYAIYQADNNNLNMAYNFLGIVDSLDIENNLIYDKLDNSNKGRINVFPVSMLPITGNVVEGTMLYDGNPAYTMPGSTIKVKTFADSLLYQTTTDANGHFTIEALNVTGAKKMEFVPNVDVESCITTADALAVMLHYVHESMLTGSRLAAADVNRSFTVNGTDALLIQKRYVNQIGTFPNGDMYYHLYDSVAYPIDTCQVAITALCYGDVNGSYHALRDGVNLLNEGQILVGSEQEYNIPVRVQSGIEAGAISLKLAYPEEYLSIEAVTLPNGEEAMLSAQNGMLTISWYDLNPLYLNDDGILLTLKVHTKDLSSLEESIAFGLGGYSELADSNAGILGDVVLVMPEMVTLSTLSLNEQNDNMTLSVYPNPMKDRSIIRYALTSEGRVNFVVYDLLGNTVKAFEEGHQDIGQHEIELTGLASGVYVGRLVVSGAQEKVQIVKIVVE